MNIKKINVNILGEKHQGVFGDIVRHELGLVIILNGYKILATSNGNAAIVDFDGICLFTEKCQIYRWRKGYDKARQNKEGKESRKGRNCWKVEHGRSKKGVRTKP